MGLDMYLTKSTYIGAEYTHNKVSGNVKIEKDGQNVPIKFSRISEIKERVGYWRKANAVHRWFVKNVQSGKDDCHTYEVSKPEVIELLNICKQIKEHPEKAPELLPTADGFFFGSTEYGEGYMYGIDTTIEILEGVLAESNPEKEYFDFELEYRSSW